MIDVSFMLINLTKYHLETFLFLPLKCRDAMSLSLTGNILLKTGKLDHLFVI